MKKLALAITDRVVPPGGLVDRTLTICVMRYWPPQRLRWQKAAIEYIRKHDALLLGEGLLRDHVSLGLFDFIAACGAPLDRIPGSNKPMCHLCTRLATKAGRDEDLQARLERNRR